ncbi:DinB family protein [Mucilaginibacter sp. UR6-1]|uniref:DinB family protein n=1 Tax=Mucilaginibacter sp. UR6-1 TaxID=1435643 RepID=UPI001E4F8FBF|nr:DinB family protein [Mucilaginibacter sp. UR6-1]MCC8410135.1 DinB family protein [Mucilaginibacter sp. UR6-1]
METLKLTKGQMLHELQDILDTFVYEFERMPAEKINSMPFAGSWTAAQVAEHLILSANAFVGLMQGPTQDTQRPPDALVDELRTILGNMEIKMQSPDFIWPAENEYVKNEQLNKLQKVTELLFNAAATLDLDKTCTGFELPQMGHITRRESVAFITYHTRRHTHQLKNIKKALV